MFTPYIRGASDPSSLMASGSTVRGLPTKCIMQVFGNKSSYKNFMKCFCSLSTILGKSRRIFPRFDRNRQTSVGTILSKLTECTLIVAIGLRQAQDIFVDKILQTMEKICRNWV